MDSEEIIETTSGSSDAASEEESRRASGKHLSSEQWAELRRLYSTGEVKTAAELADRFGVTKSAISQHFKKHRVVRIPGALEEPKAASASVTPAPAPAPLTFADKRNARIEQTREESYNWARMVSMKSLKLIAEAESRGLPVSALKEDIRVLRMQTQQLVEAGRFRLEMLQADQHVDENELPQIHIKDLSDKDIEELRAADDEEEDSTIEEEGIVVTS